MRKIYLLLFILVLSIFSGCANSKEASNVNQLKTVKIGTPDAAGNLDGLAGIAHDKSFLDEELKKIGYQSEIVGFAGAGPAVNEALIGKSIDFAILADFPTITAKSKGVDTKLLAIVNSNANCSIAVSPNSQYNSIVDLKGKKIAIPKGTYMQRFFVSLIKENALQESDFEIVQMTTDMESALVAGAVDAILFTDNEINKIVFQNKNARIIESSNDYPDYSGQMLFVGRSDYIEQNQDVAVAIINSLYNSKQFAQEQPKEAITILATANKTTDEVAENTYHYQKADTLNNELLQPTDATLKKLEETKTFLLDNKLITVDFAINEWYDSSVYDKINPNTEVKTNTDKPYLEFIDALQNKVVLDKKPQRVVSLYGSYAQMWLLAGGSLVGVTDDVVNERKLDVGNDVTIIGTVKDPSIEKILSLNPDFIILSNVYKTQVDMAETFEKSNIPYAYFNVETFDNYLQVLDTFTTITGDKQLYETNGLAVEKQINEIINKTKSIDSKPKVLLLRAFSSGVKTLDEKSLTGEMLNDLGAINLATKYPSLLDQLSMEIILKEEPDFIFVTTMGDSDKALQQMQSFIDSNPAWNSLSAIKASKYFVLPKDLFHFKPNNRWGEAYEQLAKKLYPEQFN